MCCKGTHTCGAEHVSAQRDFIVAVIVSGSLPELGYAKQRDAAPLFLCVPLWHTAWVVGFSVPFLFSPYHPCCHFSGSINGAWKSKKRTKNVKNRILYDILINKFAYVKKML